MIKYNRTDKGFKNIYGNIKSATTRIKLYIYMELI